jgi:murein DD-endopeptidase MepM/ murein hydrolase activator NlpD
VDENNNQNKNEKKPDEFFSKAGKFIIGKGFYIVLFLCIAAIGISGYVIFYTGNSSINPDFTDITDIGLSTTIPYSDIGLSTTEPEPDEVAGTTLIPDSTTAATTDEESGNVKLFYVRPVSGAVLKEYSGDVPVYNPTMDDWRVHTGIDIRASSGDKVCAVASGKVSAIYKDDFKGTVVEIKHTDGNTSIYCGLMASPVVNVGDNVSAGTVIGSVGDTAIFESSDVSHLHFELKKDGEYINPSETLPSSAN